MKIYFFIVLLVSTTTQKVLAQYNIPGFDHTLLLEATADKTANVSFGDFDGDGHPDILLVKGRHWPIVDRVLLGDGVDRCSPLRRSQCFVFWQYQIKKSQMKPSSAGPLRYASGHLHC